MPQDKVQEILNKLTDEYECELVGFPEAIIQARQLLWKEIEEVLPAERNYTVEEVLRLQKCDGTSADYIQGFVSGNNVMLSDTKQVLKKVVLGEK